MAHVAAHGTSCMWQPTLRARGSCTMLTLPIAFPTNTHAPLLGRYLCGQLSVPICSARCARFPRCQSAAVGHGVDTSREWHMRAAAPCKTGCLCCAMTSRANRMSVKISTDHHMRLASPGLFTKQRL